MCVRIMILKSPLVNSKAVKLDKNHNEIAVRLVLRKHVERQIS